MLTIIVWGWVWGDSIEVADADKNEAPCLTRGLRSVARRRGVGTAHRPRPDGVPGRGDGPLGFGFALAQQTWALPSQHPIAPAGHYMVAGGAPRAPPAKESSYCSDLELHVQH